MILKMMSGQDMPDENCSKDCTIVSNVQKVDFCRDAETDEPKLTVRYDDTCKETPRSILHVTVGNSRYKPSVEDLKYVTELFLNADKDPLGAIVATGTNVTTKELFVDPKTEVFVMQGNAYLMNDNGKTIQSYAFSSYQDLYSNLTAQI